MASDTTESKRSQVIEDVPQVVSLPLEYHASDSLATRFANQVSVQVDAGIYIVTFYESIPPVYAASTHEEQAALLSKLGSLRAEAVARIALPIGKGQDLARILQMMTERIASLESASAVGATAGET